MLGKVVACFKFVGGAWGMKLLWLMAGLNWFGNWIDPQAVPTIAQLPINVHPHLLCSDLR